MRGRLIQAVAWEECRIEHRRTIRMRSPASWSYPQDDRSDHLHRRAHVLRRRSRARGDRRRRAALTCGCCDPRPRSKRFFELEAEDSALLAQLQPGPQRGARSSSRAPLTRSRRYQLLCMLRLADMVELATAPFAPAQSVPACAARRRTRQPQPTRAAGAGARAAPAASIAHACRRVRDQSASQSVASRACRSHAKTRPREPGESARAGRARRAGDHARLAASHACRGGSR